MWNMRGDKKKISRFPVTRWSLVGRAGASDEMTRQRALGELLHLYGPALRAFLVEARRIPVDLADDLLQQFIADKIMAAQLIRKADQGRGKFRNFVVKSLSNFVSTRLKSVYKEQARMTALHEVSSSLATSSRAVYCFEQEWVQQVVVDALDMMEKDCVQRGRTDLWGIFGRRVVGPLLREEEPASYEAVVEEFQIASPRQAINLLASAKRVFVRHLRAAVGRYVEGDERIDREIEDLRAIVER